MAMFHKYVKSPEGMTGFARLRGTNPKVVCCRFAKCNYNIGAS